MPRPDPRAPGEGQDALFEASPQTLPGKVLRGRHSDAMDRALDAARTKKLISDEDEGAATILRAGAWALDSFEHQGRPYGPAKLVPALTEALRELHMTPESRQTDMDAEIAGLLTDLAKVEADDPEGADGGNAALHHPEA